MNETASKPLSRASVIPGRHDGRERRKSQRRGREKGCWVYIAAEQLQAAGLEVEGPPPRYVIYAGERGRFVVTLYPEPTGAKVAGSEAS